jgi:hypothetical protein
MRYANVLAVGITPMIAQGENAMTSRTHKALTAAKARGHAHGHCLTLVAGPGQQQATTRTKGIAAGKAHDLLMIIEEIQAGGNASMKGIARELQARQVQTPRRGTTWQAIQVRRSAGRDATA